ncbi:MAG: phosphoribosylanthranilate isomerase [bacterium]
MTRIKICGITSQEDALLCVQAGADALGLNFYAPSPRYITVSRAREIVAAVPPFVFLVGLFVDEDLSEVQRIMDETGLHIAQFHGTESPEILRRYGRPTIKAFRIQSAEDLKAMKDFNAAAFLLDTYRKGLPGGTGKTFDWHLAQDAARENRVILAGGLTPENVGEAIRLVRPFAVDVASGVESSPGKKDPDLVHRFVEAVREADCGLHKFYSKNSPS